MSRALMVDPHTPILKVKTLHIFEDSPKVIEGLILTFPVHKACAVACPLTLCDSGFFMVFPA